MHSVADFPSPNKYFDEICHKTASDPLKTAKTMLGLQFEPAIFSTVKVLATDSRIKQTFHGNRRADSGAISVFEGFADAYSTILIDADGSKYLLTDELLLCPSGSQLRVIGFLNNKIVIWTESFANRGTLILWDTRTQHADILFESNNEGLVSINHKRILATSRDGTSIPVDCYGALTSNAPTILHIYGGFGKSLCSGYSPAIDVGWISRGMTFAIAHTRGGDEFGQNWHKAAMRGGRFQVREDVLSALDSLVRHNVSTKDSLCLHGMSHGGLIAATTSIKEPSAVAITVCQAPLIRTDLLHESDISLNWISEYGDPQSGDWEDFMQQEDPLSCTPPDRSISNSRWLITAHVSDKITPIIHADSLSKFLLSHNAQVKYLRYTNEESGHFGSSIKKQRIRESYNLLNYLNMKMPQIDDIHRM